MICQMVPRAHEGSESLLSAMWVVNQCFGTFVSSTGVIPSGAVLQAEGGISRVEC